MSESTQLVTPEQDLVREIKELHTENMTIANDAEQKLLSMCDQSRRIGALLEQARSLVPSRDWSNWLVANFGEAFVPKAKVYRKAVDADPRQCVLSLGVIPQADNQSCKAANAALVKPPAHINWINKLTGHLRGCESLDVGEQVALKDLSAQLHRLGVAPGKESL